MKAVVTVGNKLVLVREDSDKWDLPGGGIEHQETITDAFKREIKEELGVEPNGFDPLKPTPIFMHDTSAGRPLLFLLYRTNLSEDLPSKNNTGTEIGTFSVEEFIDLELETHLKEHRELIQKLAF